MAFAVCSAFPYISRCFLRFILLHFQADSLIYRNRSTKMYVIKLLILYFVWFMPYHEVTCLVNPGQAESESGWVLQNELNQDRVGTSGVSRIKVGFILSAFRFLFISFLHIFMDSQNFNIISFDNPANSYDCCGTDFFSQSCSSSLRPLFCQAGL